MLNVIQLSAPLQVDWEITPDCNHQCLHCYNYWRENNSHIPNLQVRKRVELYSKIIQEILQNKVLRVIITGGEPLPLFKVIYPYLRILKNNNVSIELNTNITYLTPLIAKKIKELDIELFTSFPSYNSSTTDLITNIPGSFEKIEKGIKLARKYGIEIIVNMVVSKVNIGHIFKTAEYLKSVGINHFGATKACTPINCDDFSKLALTAEDARSIFLTLIEIKDKLGIKVDSFIGYPTCLFTSTKMFDLLNGRTCHGGQSICAIGSDGEIRACAHLETSYGNIMECGLKTAWKRMAEWRDGSLTPEQCRQCKHFYTCAGGCKAEAFKRFGRLDLPDPYSDFTSPIISENTFDNKNKMLYVPKGHYIVDPKVAFRNEDEGGILVTPKRLVKLNNNTFEYIKKQIGKEVTINDFISNFGWKSRQAKDFYSHLVQDKILIRPSRKHKSTGKTSNPFCPVV